MKVKGVNVLKMKRRLIVFLQITMLLLMCFPAVALADDPPTMSLGETSARVGDSVTVSGTQHLQRPGFR